MGDERPTHVVVDNLPEATALGELASAETDEFDARLDKGAGSHVGTVSLARNIRLHEFVPVRNYTLEREIVHL